MYESVNVPHPRLFLGLTVFNYSSTGGCVMVLHCGLICISLMTNELEHFFICLSAFRTSGYPFLSLVESFAYFFLFSFLLFS